MRRHHPLSRQALHTALDGVIRAWVAATCVWDNDWSLGDHRFVIFLVDVAPQTQVYVQLWSEPLEPVLWEVSSGRWNPPADKWLAGARSERIAAFGFEIGGHADNFQREVTIVSRADLTRVARTIVDILYAGFDYRGTTNLNARLCYDSRAEIRPVLMSLTPEDLTKIFTASGYKLVGENDDDDEPVLLFRTRGLLATVAFERRVEDQHLFEVAVITCDVTLTPEDAERARLLMDAGTPADDEVNTAVIGTTLHFAGGVTEEWLVRRVSEWTRTMLRYRRDARRKERSAGAYSPETVH